MTDKPLEWKVSLFGEERYEAGGDSPGSLYAVYRDRAYYWAAGNEGIGEPIPGPYDGTIETAKQRCEEHRRKVNP